MQNEMTEFQKMRAGLPYHNPDAEIFALQSEATQQYLAVNRTEGAADRSERDRLLRESLGSFGRSFLNPPVRWEYGKHIFIGDTCLINTNCLFMDGADIRTGNHTLIAPNCSLITASHPLEYEDRMTIDPETGNATGGYGINTPITIGTGCWIGAGATILPGVTIGDGTTVAAGSVVTKSLPSRVLAAGVPAKVIRELKPG
ncbi:MAG: sugar O-acetyltransferase [Boseongicola sp.]|nr:MAG: sugar O-acetyltransferase [Boseongicola sp.]